MDKQGLDFADMSDFNKSSTERFPKDYREKIYSTFHSIDEKAFYLFKMVYEKDRRYAFERIEWFDDWSEDLPIFV